MLRAVFLDVNSGIPKIRCCQLNYLLISANSYNGRQFTFLLNVKFRVRISPYVYRFPDFSSVTSCVFLEDFGILTINIVVLQWAATGDLALGAVDVC